MALRGAELTVPRDDGDARGGRVLGRRTSRAARSSTATSPVGFVRRMRALPSVEVLEVDRPDGSELLVPLVRDCIRSIDVEARRIDVDLGFLGER